MSRRAVLVVTTSLVLGLSGCYDQIDRCLDAGGQWERARGECVFEEAG